MSDRIKNKVQEKFSITEYAYHMTVSILIGIGIGLVLLGVVAYATRDTRPTQYFFLYINEKLGAEIFEIDRMQNSEDTLFN